MAYKITGTVLAITPAIDFKSRSGNTYVKRDLIMTVRLFDPYTGQPEEQTNNTPKFTFFGDRCRDLDNFNIGDVVTVNFDISGRSYEKDGRIEYMTDVRPLGVNLSKQALNAYYASQAPATQYAVEDNVNPTQPVSPGMTFAQNDTNPRQVDDLPF